ncbi:MAG: hypothetical protein WEE89_04875 [Gemmatimonadota bacterium]
MGRNLGRSGGFTSLPDLLEWLTRAPEGTAVQASTIAHVLRPLVDQPQQADAQPAQPETWRTRLWTCPAETRLGVREVAEAIGHPVSWVYRRTQKTATDRLPFRRLDGELVFTAGELRAWIRAAEEIVSAGPMDTPQHLKVVNR